MQFHNQQSDLTAAHQTVTEALGVKNASANGTAKLLADLGNTPAPAKTLEEQLSDIRTRIVNRVGPNHKVRVSYYCDDSGLPYYVLITLPGGQAVSSVGDDLIDTAIRTLNKWSDEKQRTMIAERVEREMRLASKIDAADLLTGEIFRDDGNATDVLPLTSTGPSGIGGEYQREVMP